MIPRLICICVFIGVTLCGRGQYFQKEKKLIDNIGNAASEKERVGALAALAEFYYIYKDERKGDSLLQKQLLLAEVSNDKQLVKEALFNDAIVNLSEWASTETFDKALTFIDKGLKYAEETGNEDYEAVAHLRKSSVYRKRGTYDLALQQATQALSNIAQSKNDSLKIMVYLEVGNVFLAKGDAVAAYKNFNTAYEIAYSKKYPHLLSECYHRFALLYESLSNKELTKQSLLKSLDINTKHANEAGLFNDYIGLARLTNEKEYFDKVLLLAEKADMERYRLQAKRLMFAYLMAVKKSSKQALAYLESNEDLRQSYINTGKGNYQWVIGNVFRYSGNVDSALHYYSLAEPHLQTSYDLSVRKTVFKGMAECFEKTGQTSNALLYYEKAFAISRQQNDLPTLSSVSNALGALYAGTGDHARAYQYSKLHNHYRDTLETLADQRDVVMLEVERENKKHENDLAEAEAKALKLRNLQYMGISIAIAAILTILVVAGMFPVSKLVVKMAGFVAFICLFEFIILLIDTWLHNLAHGEPLKIWLCKIVIIALLMPLHHYIEHAVVGFLSSRKLVKVRENISFKKLLPKKKPAPVVEAGEETMMHKN